MLRKATHVLLALALVVTTTGLTGRVLCLGGDGHREIEAQNAACCGAKALGPWVMVRRSTRDAPASASTRRSR
jgi:hypothetical protein